VAPDAIQKAIPVNTMQLGISFPTETKDESPTKLIKKGSNKVKDNDEDNLKDDEGDKKFEDEKDAGKSTKS
jgi:hypothetical protein